jgi:hypothetical protein
MPCTTVSENNNNNEVGVAMNGGVENAADGGTPPIEDGEVVVAVNAPLSPVNQFRVRLSRVEANLARSQLDEVERERVQGGRVATRVMRPIIKPIGDQLLNGGADGGNDGKFNDTGLKRVREEDLEEEDEGGVKKRGEGVADSSHDGDRGNNYDDNNNTNDRSSRRVKRVRFFDLEPSLFGRCDSSSALGGANTTDLPGLSAEGGDASK